MRFFLKASLVPTHTINETEMKIKQFYGRFIVIY